MKKASKKPSYDIRRLCRELKEVFEAEQNDMAGRVYHHYKPDDCWWVELTVEQLNFLSLLFAPNMTAEESEAHYQTIKSLCEKEIEARKDSTR